MTSSRTLDRRHSTGRLACRLAPVSWSASCAATGLSKTVCTGSATSP